MEVDYQEIGRRIAARRKKLGLKQAEVCEMCDLSDKYLSCIERATSIPSLDVILRICAALKTTPDEILLGTIVGSIPDYQQGILKRLEAFDEKQLKFVSSFLEWYEGQSE